eukprot:NODE_5924_length_896_cov_56.368693_g5696_i0.p1 GENE.NODE_5924_length_896_cov_56.368693_g5696_i0~~NODE_5924_length_896_cov_56.368693_g5696_i0.p1  ORF type:complete len:265 (-),score=62.19 NODE_5924_length_896_cov_56.368693_g5696_i0:101-856(-)
MSLWPDPQRRGTPSRNTPTRRSGYSNNGSNSGYNTPQRRAPPPPPDDIQRELYEGYVQVQRSMHQIPLDYDSFWENIGKNFARTQPTATTANRHIPMQQEQARSETPEGRSSRAKKPSKSKRKGGILSRIAGAIAGKRSSPAPERPGGQQEQDEGEYWEEEEDDAYRRRFDDDFRVPMQPVVYEQAPVVYEQPVMYQPVPVAAPAPPVIGKAAGSFRGATPTNRAGAFGTGYEKLTNKRTRPNVDPNPSAF